MIFSNIILGLIILFFGIRLFSAIQEKRKKQGKIHLISRQTGRIFEIDASQMSDFLNKELLSDFTNTAKMMFKCIAEAFAKGHLAEVKNYLNDNVLPVFQEKIDLRVANKQKAEFTLIGFKDVKLLEDLPDKKVVSFTTEQVNLLKDNDDHIIEGDPLYVATVTEYWTFIRSRDFSEKAYNSHECPNCGAEIKLNQAGKCEYCGTVVTSGNFDWVLSRIEQDESYVG